MRRLHTLSLFLALLIPLSLSLHAQRNPGSLIVQLAPTASVESFLRNSPNQLLQYQRTLVPGMNIHLLHFEESEIGAEVMLEWAKGQPTVQVVQYDHQLTLRKSQATFPDDPSFGAQWHLHNTGQGTGVVDADIDAPEAWDLATGGMGPLGDTLVLAVIDEGADLTHEDLYFWKNHQEIGENGIDDDQNGYVDDYEGWNAYTGTGSLPSARHATHVAGIAAGRGNNTTGITGVNWNLQVMNIAGSSTSEATVIEAYGYVWAQRKRYELTKGAEGAYVIATNSSFGVDNGDVADFPIWCAMYDSLGAYGILNAASTANSGVNVDRVGDMPSTCASEFLIIVTNTNDQDARNNGAAYGPTHVDLGAPGTWITSTIPDNKYSIQSGTSMATPLVAGAIALMHADASNTFAARFKNYPDSMAAVIKSCILQSVDSLPTLDSTVSAGRLNLYQSLLHLRAYATGLAPCSPPYDLAVDQVTDTSVLATWNALSNSQSYFLRYRQQGQSTWQYMTSNNMNLTISGLSACRDYEYQVASICGMDTSTWSAIFAFASEGCCRPPVNGQAIMVTDSSAVLTWDAVYAAAGGYVVNFQEIGTAVWIRDTVTTTSFAVGNLQPCTVHGFFIEVLCDTGASPISTIWRFTTKGCGFCVEGTFCASISQDATEDWIDTVSIAGLTNGTGKDGGYGDYTTFSVDLDPGQSYPYRLVPGFLNMPFGEYWRVWIDYNRDGDFEDANELVIDPGMTQATPLEGAFTVPDTINSGPTRMRISMRFSISPSPCENFLFGEVEDYCVNITGTRSLNSSHSTSLSLYPNPAQTVLYGRSDRPIQQIQLYDVMGKLVHRETIQSTDFQLDVTTLPRGVYLISLQFAEGKVTRRVVLRKK